MRQELEQQNKELLEQLQQRNDNKEALKNELEELKTTKDLEIEALKNEILILRNQNKENETEIISLKEQLQYLLLIIFLKNCKLILALATKTIARQC